MSDPLFSPHWYRVRDLRPQLRPHATITRQQFRGETWFLLRDPGRERFHRMSAAAERVAGMMDGSRSVDEIWRAATRSLGDDAPTQDAIIRLLGELHHAEALLTDVPADVRELLERADTQRRKETRGRWLSPLAIRIPLVDPQAFLDASLPLLRPLFGWTGALLWAGVVVAGVATAAANWDELGAGVLDAVLTGEGLFTLWLLFPVVKVLHELGHAWAVRALGGEVHEIGVMLLVLTPVPYVDASASWAFRSKYQRALVGAAGMAVEVFVASLALFVWALAEPGIVRATAYNIALVSGASTVLFNLNPLLRFDGYYIAQDLLELPNLRGRANQYVRALVDRYAFGSQDVDLPDQSPSERAWLLGFAVASSLYRVVVLSAILLWLLDIWFLGGVVLGGVTVVMWLVVPSYRALKRVLTAPSLRRVRSRAVGVTLATSIALLAACAVVPMPQRTNAEGVVRLPEASFVRAGSDGFVAALHAESGQRVDVGSLLVQLEDPQLASAEAILGARVRELRARIALSDRDDRAYAQRLGEQLGYERDRLERARERGRQLLVHSSAEGELVLPRQEDLAGRFVRQGELLGHVVDRSSVQVRVIVPQADVDRVRHAQRVSVRLSERLERVLPAEVERIAPGASAELPSPALGSRSGGEIVVDPRDESGLRSLAPIFNVDLRIDSSTLRVNPGGRVYVQFDEGRAPLVAQAWRALRQLFLARFHV